MLFFKSISFSRAVISALVLVFFLTLLAESAPLSASTETGKGTLVVYGIAAAKEALRKINDLFEKETGIKVEANYVGCFATVSQQLQAGNQVDIFIPGSMDIAKSMLEQGIISTALPVVENRTCLVVPKGSAVVREFMDIARPGVRLAFGNFKVTPIGKYTVEILKKAGIYRKIRKNITTQALCIDMMMTYVEEKNVDAALVWEKDYRESGKVDMVPIPQEFTVSEQLPLCRIAGSKNPSLQQQYCDFFMTRGLEILASSGYTLVQREKAPVSVETGEAGLSGEAALTGEAVSSSRENP